MKPDSPTNSLAFRLIVAATAWLAVVLPVAAILLNSLYRGEVERAFDKRLELVMETMAAESTASSQSGLPVMPTDLGEPLFKIPLSGWYWQIRPLDPGLGGQMQSPSLVGEHLVLPSELGIRADKNKRWFTDLIGPDKKSIRIMERVVSLAEGEEVHHYSFAVGGMRAEIDQSVYAFRNMLVLALAILGAGLIVATLIQVRFGLLPLQRVEEGLAAIRSGKASRLDGSWPREIVPLQKQLNALLQSNQDIVERARTHVGNLAHALKTPLAVIQNEAGEEKSGFARKVAEQATLMRDQVNHYLDRARMAARLGVIGGETEVQPVVEALARTLKRIYRDRELSITIDCHYAARFQGERQDLEEQLGNLMDNACKWAKSRIDVRVALDWGTSRTHPERLVLMVDDDGPGLNPEERKLVVQRGRRLDETKPGSGLGLSIVADLAHLYRGSLVLDESPLGGLQARLTLPAC